MALKQLNMIYERVLERIQLTHNYYSQINDLSNITNVIS